MLNKAIFLDRDGVINREKEHYIVSCNDFELLPDVGKNLKKLQDLGYLLIVITNQSAINRKLTTHEEINKIHQLMIKQLSKFGIKITAVYYCPHKPEENCQCRKPRTKMFSDAIKDHIIDISKSWFIGDKKSDLEAGTRIGLKTLQIERNDSLASVCDIIAKTHGF